MEVSAGPRPLWEELGQASPLAPGAAVISEV